MSNISTKFKPHKDCMHWCPDNYCCRILTEPLCITKGECGFYPPTAKKRAAKIRAQRAAQLKAEAKRTKERKPKK